MLSVILFVIFCIIPELVTLAIALLVGLLTDNMVMGLIVGGVIYIFLLLTVKREIKSGTEKSRTVSPSVLTY